MNREAQVLLLFCVAHAKLDKRLHGSAVIVIA